ncbi:MAG: hypothetical protein AAF604_17685 [Acidobacteriota bacterium]
MHHLAEDRKRQRSPLAALLLALTLVAGVTPTRTAIAETLELDIGDREAITFDIASDLAGRRILVWNSLEDEQPRLFGRLYGPDGAPRSETFAVDPEGVGVQITPAVASDGRGRFVVAWKAPGAGERLIYSRAFDALANPVGPVHQLSEPDGITLGGPDVARTLDGRTLVVWDRSFFDAAPIRGRFLDSNGTPRGPVQLLRDGPIDPDDVRLEALPRVTTSAAGTFSVVWNNLGNTDLGRDIVAKLFDPSGRPRTASFSLTSSRPSFARLDPVVAATGEDRFLLTWADSLDLPLVPELFSVAIDGDTGRAEPAVPSGEVSTELNDDFPELTSDGFGNTWVAWYRETEQTESSGWFVRELATDGSVRGPALRLTPWTLQVRLTVGAAGPAMAAWVDSGRIVTRTLPRTLECSTGPGDLCLGERFRVRAWWRDPRRDQLGIAQAAPLGEVTGTFWFFDASNRELFVKVVDGRSVNDRFWFFWSGLTDLEVWLVMEDLVTGRSAVYYNPPFAPPAQADTATFVDSANPSNTRDLVHAGSPSLPRRDSAGAATAEVELQDGRFALRLEFDDPRVGQGVGQGRALSPETAAFSFFGENDLELLVKILDGRPINGSFWVFRAQLTDIGYTLTITDRRLGTVQRYRNPPFRLASDIDTQTFPAENDRRTAP